MREMMARMIRCGVPRDVARCVCKYYRHRHDMHGLELYVEAVEEESYECMERV